MKQSIKALTPQYDARRMLDDYARLLYDPAHEYRAETRSENFTRSRNRAAWNNQVQAAWPQVRFVEMSAAPHGPLFSGETMPMRVLVDLAGLVPADVRVEAVVGRIDSDGALGDAEIVSLKPLEQRSNAWAFGCDYAPNQTGRLGCAFRISSNHFDHALTRPTHAFLSGADVGWRSRRL